MAIAPPHHPRRRRTLLALASAPLALAAVALPATTAHAASTATCTGTSDITYDPGLTNTPQTIAYTESDTFTCLSTIVGLNSGASVTSVSIPGASCTGFGVATDTPYEITWNNGATSQIGLSFTDAIVAGEEQVTGTGTVTSGPFTGGNATIVWLYPLLNPLTCATAQGVTSQSGALTAQITSLT